MVIVNIVPSLVECHLVTKKSFFFFIQENIVLIPIHYLSPLLNHQVSHVDVFDINIGALISMCCC